MITYKLTLKCSRCSCDVTIENEKPKWRRDNHVVDALNKARKFVLTHPKVTRTDWRIPFNIPELVSVTTVKAFVGSIALFEADTYVQYKEFHFIDCPACVSGRCYLGSGMKD